MDMRKLNIQIARLLNESNKYTCGFTASGDHVWATITDGPGVTRSTLHSWKIDPAMFLEHIKAACYEVSQTD